MTIQDAAATPPGESVFTRYFSDVDGDLEGFAAHYGTSAHALVEHADAHTPGRTVSDPAATTALIERGEAFALRLPADEARFAWGTYRNDGGREQTLADVVREINQHPWPQAEPRATARQLWSYAINADLRSGALHGRGRDAQRRFDEDPATAPIAAGATVRFPLVRSGATNVCAANGCTSVATPRPAWLSTYEAEILEIERLGARMLGYRELLGELQTHAVMQAARVDFIVEYLNRLASDQHGSNEDAADAVALRERFQTLRGALQTTVLDPGPATHRPTWMEAHRRFSRELATRLRDDRFVRWNAQVLDHWQDLGLDAAYFNGLCAQQAMVIEELGFSDTRECRALIAAVGDVLHGADPGIDSALTAAVRRWASLIQAVVGDTPGPASLAGAVMKVHLLQVLLAADHAAFPRTAREWLRAMVQSLGGDGDPRAEALRHAFELPNTMERLPAARAAFEASAARQGFEAGPSRARYGAAMGRFASGLAGALAIYTFFTTWNDPPARSDLLGRATRAVQFISGGAGAFSGAVALVQSPAELLSEGVQKTLNGAAQGLGTVLTWTLGFLSLVQGILQIVDGVQQGDRVAIASGVVTALGGLATLAGIALAVPGLEALGAVLGVVAALIGIVQSLGTAPAAQQLLIEVLRHVTEDPVTIPNSHGERVDLHGMSGASLFHYVVTTEHASQLATAHTQARDALLRWNGARLDRTPANIAWLQQNRLADIVDQITQPPLSRHPELERPAGVPTDAAVTD